MSGDVLRDILCEQMDAYSDLRIRLDEACRTGNVIRIHELRTEIEETLDVTVFMVNWLKEETK